MYPALLVIISFLLVTIQLESSTIQFLLQLESSRIQFLLVTIIIVELSN